jgi:hypothetical protein
MCTHTNKWWGGDESGQSDVDFWLCSTKSHSPNILITRGLTFLLKLILEQTHFVTVILCSLELSLFYPLGVENINTWEVFIDFLFYSVGWIFSYVRLLLSGVFFFLAAAFVKINSIELYSLYISRLWVYYPSHMCNFFWNISYSFSIGFLVLGGKTTWSSRVFNSLF